MAEHIRPGGMTGVRPADHDAQHAADAVRQAVEAQIGTQTKYHVTLYATQVVAGTNFFLKVDVGSKFVHLRVFRNLQGAFSLHSLQDNQSAADPLNYF